jgi:hypothetical protein
LDKRDGFDVAAHEQSLACAIKASQSDRGFNDAHINVTVAHAGLDLHRLLKIVLGPDNFSSGAKFGLAFQLWKLASAMMTVNEKQENKENRTKVTVACMETL